jgi:hypothetical protein
MSGQPMPGVVVSGTLGHKRVDLATNTYDKASTEDIR